MASYDMMDDLIASFSGNAHISQEAVDLRALQIVVQAQLSSSLMMGAPSSSRSRPCPTTPTMGTMDLAQLLPSATPSPQANVHHSFGGPSSSHQSVSQSEDWSQDMMDEEMIEQSLLGLDAQPHHQQSSSLGLQNHYPHINETPAQYYGAPQEDNSFSNYAAMDPFFAAQLQAAQQQQQQQQMQMQQASYFGGFAPARGFGARQSPSSGAFGSRF
ncbi:hypothetical protein FRB90_001106 [Tulasnella sp. 427]|nr:hypothetical protein FRB90_001106 [Tulasnella sp. 427]